MVAGSCALFFDFFELSASMTNLSLLRYSHGGTCLLRRVLSRTTCHFLSSGLSMTTCLLSLGRSIASWREREGEEGREGGREEGEEGGGREGGREGGRGERERERELTLFYTSKSDNFYHQLI